MKFITVYDPERTKQTTLDVQNKTLVSIDSPTTEQLMYLSGTSGDYIAVGYGGTIIYYDAATDTFKLHSQSGVITTKNLYFLDTTIGDGMVVGEGFTILNYTKATDTFAASAISGYDTNVNLLCTLFPYTLWGVLYDIYTGYDISTNNGVIYIWNGGAAPTKVLDTANGKIQAFTSLDWKNLIAVGNGGGIYKSGDYGATWGEVDTGITDNLTDISGTKTDEMWIVSFEGRIYKFDSDTEELTMVKDTGAALTRVWMIDENNGYAVGGEGTLLHYDGDSWTVIPSGTINAFNGIFGLENNKFYLVCSGGYIFRFYNMAYPSLNIDAAGNVLDYRRSEEDTIVDALEVRDTNAHDPDSDTEITMGVMELYNFSSIKIINTLDKDITAQVYGNFTKSTTHADTLGASFTVAAGDSETRTLVPGNDGWVPYIYLKITATGTPTTGNVTATIKKKALGG